MGLMRQWVSSWLVVASLVLVGQINTVGGQCNFEIATFENGSCLCKKPNEDYNKVLHCCHEKCGNNSVQHDCGCSCPGDGWIDTTINGIFSCEDKDECATMLCAASEECVNFEGRAFCKCKEGYFRDGKVCNNLNERYNPYWHNCSQLAIDRDPPQNFLCRCYDNIRFDQDQDCAIKTGYENCSAGDNILCVQNTTNAGDIFRMPYPGFKIVDNIAEDVNECEEINTLPSCWENSYCSNLENGAGYDCKCMDGFVGEFSTGNIRECIKIWNDSNSICGIDETCRDPCPMCKENEVCVQKSSFAACEQKLDTAVRTKELRVRIFTGTMVVYTEDLYPAYLTSSLETLLGAGSVQCYGNTGSTFNFMVMTDNVLLADANEVDIVTLLRDACVPLYPTLSETVCMLPGKILTKEMDINVTAIDGCAGEPCPDSEIYECVEQGSGRYKCECEGAVNHELMTTVDNYLQICSYVPPSTTTVLTTSGTTDDLISLSTSDEPSTTVATSNTSTPAASTTTNNAPTTTVPISNASTTASSTTTVPTTVSDGTDICDLTGELESANAVIIVLGIFTGIFAILFVLATVVAFKMKQRNDRSKI